jgi:hypothetical protein
MCGYEVPGMILLHDLEGATRLDHSKDISVHVCAMLCEAYGGEAVKESSVFEWHKRFEDSCENVEDDDRSGHPRSHRTNENAEKCRIWCIQIDF